jgi:hypothetical protein
LDTPAATVSLACSRNTLASLKRAQQQGDEWAKIYALHIKEGRELDDKAKQTAAAKAAALKQVRKRQECR